MGLFGRLADEGADILKSNGDFKKTFGDIFSASRDVSTQKSLNRKLKPDATDVYHKEQSKLGSEVAAQAAAGRSDRVIQKTGRKADLAAIEKERMNATVKNPNHVNGDGNLTEDGVNAMRKGQATSLEQHKMNRRNAIGKLGDDTKDYFTGGDFTQNAVRMGAAAGVLGTAAVGTRYMSGGSVTHNNQGRRDIAGIPFI